MAAVNEGRIHLQRSGGRFVLSISHAKVNLVDFFRVICKGTLYSSQQSGGQCFQLTRQKCLLQHFLERSVSSLDTGLSSLESRRGRRVRGRNIILSGTVTPP